MKSEASTDEACRAASPETSGRSSRPFQAGLEDNTVEVCNRRSRHLSSGWQASIVGVCRGFLVPSIKRGSPDKSGQGCVVSHTGSLSAELREKWHGVPRVDDTLKSEAHPPIHQKPKRPLGVSSRSFVMGNISI